MTQRVPDDVVAKFTRQQHDWTERVLKGSLDPVEVARVIQSIINRGQEMFSPHAYFKTRPGLYVWNTFEEHILSEQKKSIPYRGLEGVKNSMLPRNMSDQEIIDEILGGMDELRKHSFTLDQIAAKIDLQPNGEDGELLNNGYANIFYVVLVNEGFFAVSVLWDSGDHEWNVDACPLDENGNWLAVRQVFRNMTLVI